RGTRAGCEQADQAKSERRPCHFVTRRNEVQLSPISPAAAASGCCRTTGVSLGQPILPADARIDLRAAALLPLLRARVECDQAEARAPALGPFEVVDQRPVEIAADVGAQPQRVVQRAEVID